MDLPRPLTRLSMNHYLRNILALMAAVWLAIPTPGNGGGENNGGSGVWILPACAGLTVGQSSAPRAEHVVANTSADIKVQVDNNMGTAAATFTDDLSGTTTGMQVTGRIVTVPKQLLQALQQSPVLSGTLLITDASQTGYFIRLTIQSDGKVRLQVF